MMRSRIVALMGAAVCLTVACADPLVHPEGAVAVYDRGAVTVEDVDGAILDLGATSRPSPGQATDEWYREFVRELTFGRLLLEEVRSGDLLSGPDWMWREVEALRRTAQQVFVARLPPVARPTEEEVRAEFDADPQVQQRPNSRRVAHIFLRAGAERSAEQVEAELERIRQRVLAGESFGLLAGELSESETRHRDGEMGWLRADQLGTLAPRVFSLPLRTPSEPVMSASGGNIFYVLEAMDERRFEFDEVQGLLAERLFRDRLATRFELAVEDLPPPAEPSFVADDEELRTLLAGGQDDTVVLQLGAFSLDLAGLRRRLSGGTGVDDPIARAREILEQLEDRERIYQYVVAQGWLEEPAVAERLSAELDRVARSHLREMKIAERIRGSRDEVEAYFEARRRRFTAPLRLSLRELRVPIDPASANRVMRRLEAAVEEIDRGEATLETLRQELGGEVRDLGWARLADLVKAVPTAAAQASALETTGCLPPFRREESLHLLEVVERDDPVELEFSEVAVQVERAYLEENRAELARAVRDEVLAAAGFRFVVEDVAAVMTESALVD